MQKYNNFLLSFMGNEEETKNKYKEYHVMKKGGRMVKVTGYLLVKLEGHFMYAFIYLFLKGKGMCAL